MTLPEVGRLYAHKRKKPGFYLEVKEVDEENGRVRYARTGFKGLELDLRDKQRDVEPWISIENFNRFWRPARLGH